MAKSRFYYQVGPGCLMCVYECPAKAISVRENESAFIDAEKCVGCGRCIANCQSEAIYRLERKETDD